MSRFIVFLVFIATGHLCAQSSASEEELKVKQAVDTFFEGFHKGDTLLMRTVLADKVVMQSTFNNENGENVLQDSNMNDFVKAIAKRPVDQKWDERLLDYKIQIDGTMANVWTPYEFWLNDSFSHCGVNSFQLFNDNGQWKIIYLIDTRRREGCQE
jgi:hypothetical protein